MKPFESINKGYNSVFVSGELSLGVALPAVYNPAGTLPNMSQQLERAKLIEQLGFKALWVRDIPLNVPAFGAVGQMYDPFTYLGYLAGQTSDIALGTASIALPLHHPLHVAKSAATIDQLSGGRMILGVASGDRPDEYPAMGFDFENRGELFQESFSYIRSAQESFPSLETKNFGVLDGKVDVLPKGQSHKIPMLITGHSRQSAEWNAAHGDGWMYYLRNPQYSQSTITDWRNLVAKHAAHDKPFMQAMYIILDANPDFKPQPIQLGFKTGVNFLNEFLQILKEVGVNHIAFNLRFNMMDMDTTLQILAEKVLPNFHTSQKATSTV